MSEFKGTKGEWKADYGGEITSNNRFICDCAILTEEDKYNAQLISCTPEMLELLQALKITLDDGSHPEKGSYFHQMLTDLITKATTI